MVRKRTAGRLVLGLATQFSVLVLACAATAPGAPTSTAAPTTPSALATPTPTHAPTSTPSPAPTQLAVAAPAPTLPLTPTLLPTPIPIPSPTPAPTVAPTSTLLPTQTPFPSPTPAPTATLGPAQVTVNKTEASVDFPNSIAFSLEASSTLTVDKIALEYGTERVYSCGSPYFTVGQEFAPGTRVKTSWVWEMKKTGSILPGTMVWWRWRITDQASRQYVTAQQEILFTDSRFNWQTIARGNITIYWYAAGPTFGNSVASKVDAGLSRLRLGNLTGKPIKAFVYSNVEDIRGAVLFAKEWAGGLASPSYNIVLIAISPDELDSEVSGLTHELAHLLVNEVTFSCLGDLPAWLNEGLAVYAEGPPPPYYKDALDGAIRDNKLISVRSLTSSFPAGHGGALVAYAQSQSLVEFLINSYGWEKMRLLLATFKDGSTPDSALKKVYHLDRDGLDTLWRQYIGGR